MSPAPQRFTVEVEIEIRRAVAEDLPALEWMGLYAGHRQIIRRAFADQQAGNASLLLGVAGGFPVAQVWIDFAKKREQGTACLWAVRTFFAAGSMVMPQLQALSSNTGTSNSRVLRMEGSAAVTWNRKEAGPCGPASIVTR